MTQENAGIVREAFLAYGSGDRSAAEGARERFFHPSIEWDMSGVAGWTEKPLYRGQEVEEFLVAWADSWRDWHFDVEEVRDAGQAQVFVEIHEWGIGTESGAEVDQRRYFTIALRDGQMAHVRMFSESAEALQAAGLSERPTRS
jgi:ketosteroid isomerase-like protein